MPNKTMLPDSPNLRCASVQPVANCRRYGARHCPQHKADQGESNAQ